MYNFFVGYKIMICWFFILFYNHILRKDVHATTTWLYVCLWIHLKCPHLQTFYAIFKPTIFGKWTKNSSVT